MKKEMTELTEDDLENITAGVNDNTDTPKTPGLKCPNCHEIVPVTMTQLLAAGAFTCPNCNLQFDIDPTKSDKAKEALQKILGQSDDITKRPRSLR